MNEDMKRTYGEPTVLQETNITKYFVINEGIAQFVTDLLKSTNLPPVWTITIEPARYEGFYVATVTNLSLEDTQTQLSSTEQQHT